MNNQQIYNNILEKIKKQSANSYITYNGGCGGDIYKAIMYSSNDKLSAIRKEFRSDTLKNLKNEVDLFLHEE